MPIWLRKFTYKLILDFVNKTKPKDQTLDEQTELIKQGKIELPSQFKNKKLVKY